MLLSGRKWTLVPRFLLVPVWRRSLIGWPQLKSISHVWPSRQISTLNSWLSAFTQLTPTPWRPPETLYVDESNLPPAWSLVNTTCTVGITSPLGSVFISVGMPRPSSTTVIEL